MGISSFFYMKKFRLVPLACWSMNYVSQKHDEGMAPVAGADTVVIRSSNLHISPFVTLLTVFWTSLRFKTMHSTTVYRPLWAWNLYRKAASYPVVITQCRSHLHINSYQYFLIVDAAKSLMVWHTSNRQLSSNRLPTEWKSMKMTSYFSHTC